jgi:hypothetical protein
LGLFSGPCHKWSGIFSEPAELKIKNAAAAAGFKAPLCGRYFITFVRLLQVWGPLAGRFVSFGNAGWQAG